MSGIYNIILYRIASHRRRISTGSKVTQKNYMFCNKTGFFNYFFKILNNLSLKQ